MAELLLISVSNVKRYEDVHFPHRFYLVICGAV